MEVSHAPAPYIFFAAALSIVPISALLVHATEQIATRTGDAIGGLLNATFGNAPELSERMKVGKKEIDCTAVAAFLPPGYYEPFFPRHD